MVLHGEDSSQYYTPTTLEGCDHQLIDESKKPGLSSVIVVCIYVLTDVIPLEFQLHLTFAAMRSCPKRRAIWERAVFRPNRIAAVVCSMSAVISYCF
jgi:hypothetical protein